jgi:hypothetical protein
MDAKKLCRPKPHIVFKPKCEVYVSYKKQNERVWFDYGSKTLSASHYDKEIMINCEEAEDD